MRIGSEAPKRRTHPSIRLEAQGTARDSATSNRYRRPVTSGQGRNCRGAFNVLRSLYGTQNNAVWDSMGLFATGVSASVLLIAAHDRPFVGQIAVPPEPLLQSYRIR
jgi:hypothetical protein